MDELPEFSEWYEANYRRVLSSVLVATGAKRSRAEDAVHEAFISAYERWPRVRSFESSVGWVTKVAINKAKRNFMLRSRITGPIGVRDSGSTEVVNIDVDLWNAVSSLPARQREALALRYVEDLTQAQVASRLGVAEGTAAATLHQARKNLRSELEGDGTDG